MRIGHWIATLLCGLVTLHTFAFGKEIPAWVEDEYKQASLGIDFLSRDVFKPLISKGTWFVFYGEQSYPSPFRTA
jgi:hypothetical protein